MNTLGASLRHGHTAECTLRPANRTVRHLMRIKVTISQILDVKCVWILLFALKDINQEHEVLKHQWDYRRYYLLCKGAGSCDILLAARITSSMLTLSPNSISLCSRRIPCGRTTTVSPIGSTIYTIIQLTEVLPAVLVQWRRLHRGWGPPPECFPWSRSWKPSGRSSTRRDARTPGGPSSAHGAHKNPSARVRRQSRISSRSFMQSETVFPQILNDSSCDAEKLDESGLKSPHQNNMLIHHRKQRPTFSSKKIFPLKYGRKFCTSVPTSSFTTAYRGTPSSSSWGLREDSSAASCSHQGH